MPRFLVIALLVATSAQIASAARFFEIDDAGQDTQAANSSALFEADSSAHCENLFCREDFGRCKRFPGKCGTCPSCKQDAHKANCNLHVCHNLPKDCTAMPYSCGGCSQCAAPVLPDLNVNEHIGAGPVEGVDTVVPVGGWAHISRPRPVSPASPPSPCKGHSWEDTGRVLGQGANGKVIEVRQSGQPTSALKQSLSPEGEEDVEWEKTVMSKSQCEGVMSLMDSGPCLSPSRTPLAAAYVSAKMAGSLWDWAKGKTRLQKSQCGLAVHSQLSKAIACLHDAGFVHSDLKGDNVFYSDVDRTGCPAGLKLADFGLTVERSTTQYKYDSKYYRNVWTSTRLCVPGRT